ncbi:PLP-dependent transferase [candidate division KSB1 bacterium]|nr:PLP-dependent transferase [candidate division KSB1 bacterium]
MKDHSDMHLATKAIHGGVSEDDIRFGEVSVPIYQTSTFAFKNANDGADKFSGKKEGFIYTRLANPTIRALEKCVADLENGYDGLATASGMAAVSTLYMTFLNKDAHVISTSAVYGASRTVLERDFSRFGVQSTFVDTSDTTNIEKEIRPNTRLLYIETPANPTIALTDIKKCAEIARKHNLIFAVDNTFSSPYLQRPLDHGADVVLHSLTKFINGHSDIVGGILITKTEEHFLELRKVLRYLGGTMDPHQAWLVLRGVRSLALRLEKSTSNAMKVAEFLKHHPNVEWVSYPGLPEHPQHELAKKQMDGFGSMISFGVKKGLEGGKIVMDNVKLITLAVSLGGIESLIQHPASMTHANVDRKRRYEAHITDELVRLSVGCEDDRDIIKDLDQALNKI